MLEKAFKKKCDMGVKSQNHFGLGYRERQTSKRDVVTTEVRHGERLSVHVMTQNQHLENMIILGNTQDQVI